MFDCNEIYKLQKAQMLAHGFDPEMKNLPKVYYFDESGNDGSVNTSGGNLNLNDASTYFVLGGVAADEGITQQELNEAWGRSSSSEIKSTKVFHGDFLNTLQGENVGKLLDLVIHKNWIVHFCAVQPLYYAFTDIIDSLDVRPQEALDLKEILFEVLRNDLNLTVSIFRKNGGYPNIYPDKKDIFLDGVLSIVDAYINKHGSSHILSRLRTIVESGKQSEELIYLLAEKSNIWVHEYWLFYQQILIKYANKQLVFDMEDKVKKALMAQDIKLRGRALNNWQMTDSKGQPMIQVADMIVSLVRKFMMFIGESSESVLDNHIAMMSDLQRENLGKFCRTLYLSDSKNPFMHQYICPASVNSRVSDFVMKVVLGNY